MTQIYLQRQGLRTRGGEEESGGGRREGGSKRACMQVHNGIAMSLHTVGSIAINYCDLLHLLITELFLLPTIAELFLITQHYGAYL